jgi:hypothetical protein
MEANTDLFLKATGRSLKRSTMRDREFINRFCSFQLLPFSAYRGDMDEYLALGLKKMNTLQLEDFKKLSAQFRTSLVNNFRVFGGHAFRKHTKYQESRSVLNASLWDVMSTGLSRYQENIVEARADAIRAGFFQLMSDETFTRAITYGPNDMKRVRERFALADKMFQEVFDAHSN